MKIIHIITALNQGGAETQLSEIAHKTHCLGIKQCIITLISVNSTPLVTALEAKGIVVISPNISKFNIVFGIWRLSRLLKQEIIDDTIIQSWMYHGDFITMVALNIIQLPIPVIWNIRRSLFPTGLTGFIAKINAAFSKTVPTKIICCAQSALDTHAECGYEKTKMQVIHNGIDTDLFLPDPSLKNGLRQTLKLNDSTRLIGVIGRYDPIKGHKEFLEALLRLDFTRYPAHILMVGRDIDTVASLQTYLTHPKLSPFISILPERTDIHQIMPGLDILCLPSNSEGFPNVVAEAMSCEVPCVVTDVGAASFIVGDTGIVSKNNSSLNLSSALETMLSKSDQELNRLGENARQRIIEYFSIHITVNQYLSLYHTVLKNFKK